MLRPPTAELWWVWGCVKRVGFVHPCQIVAVVFAATIAGCVVGPDFETPSTSFSLDGSYQQSTIASAFSAPSTSLQADAKTIGQMDPWWLNFDDPVLHELISDVQRQNLSLREAYLRIVAARARLGIAGAQNTPQAFRTGDTLFRNNSENALESSSTPSEAFTTWGNGLDSTWEIDLFGRIQRGIEAADAELGAEQANYADLQLSVMAEVATTYVQVRVLQQRLQIARQNLELQLRTLAMVEARQDAGLALQLDQAEAESNVAVTSSTIPVIEQDLTIAINRLAVLLGQRPGPDFTFEYRYGTIPSLLTASVEAGLPAELLLRRPDVRKAYFEVMAANARIGVAEADRLPILTLRGTISLESRNFYTVYSADSLAHSLGPGFRWNVLNFGRLKRAIELREAEHGQSLVKFESTVLEGVAEVEAALVEFARQSQRISALERVVEATNRSVEISLIRYEQNLINFDRVLDAQRSLAGAQSNLASGRGDVLFAYIRLYKSLGGGLP